MFFFRFLLLFDCAGCQAKQVSEVAASVWLILPHDLSQFLSVFHSAIDCGFGKL